MSPHLERQLVNIISEANSITLATPTQLQSCLLCDGEDDHPALQTSSRIVLSRSTGALNLGVRKLGDAASNGLAVEGGRRQKKKNS